MPRKQFITRTVTVEVVIADEAGRTDALTRWETKDWRTQFYAFEKQVDLFDHLFHNCVENGVRDLSRLDGWADLPEGLVMMRIAYVS